MALALNRTKRLFLVLLAIAAVALIALTLSSRDKAEALPPGYAIYTSDHVCPNGSNCFNARPCPTGRKVVGGGYAWLSGGFGGGFRVFKSAPSSAGNGWDVRIQNATGQNFTYRITAICVS